VVVLLLMTLALPGAAQLTGVELDIKREFLGVGGVVQRGFWTPVRVDLINNGAENIDIDCRWLLTDDDGDELVAERKQITLTPQRPQSVWLYANPPMTTRPSDTWLFQVVSTKSGELINQAQVQISESALVEPAVNLVGVCGYKGLGLTPWQRWSTQHEPLRLVSGLSLETLPDRWYGLNGLSSLVWFPVEGGEPTSSRMSDASKRALREWVYRGGHLVLILPYGGQQWSSGDSGLSDLIEPLKPSAIKQTSVRPPINVFGVLRNNDPVPLLWFDLDNAPGYTAMANVEVTTGAAADGSAIKSEKPLIVGHRYGFGQVTVVGIDLSESGVLKSLDSFRLHRVWTRIFSWRGSRTGELIPASEFENPQTRNQYVEAKEANHVEIGNWVAPRVAREGETGPAIGLAFILFVIYAIAAAFTFPNLLRTKGWERHSWVLFVGIVALFSIIAWGGAWAIRPSSSAASHFTVLDIDGNTNIVHARSWQSLLIPSFSNAQIAVPSETDGLARMDVVNLLASPGLSLNPETPGYPDQRSYDFDAAKPNVIDVPMRSTTKSIVVDYLGQITAQRPGMSKAWDMPQATITMGRNGLPTGTITHRFAGALTDVIVIFCPGGGQEPGPPGLIRPDGRPLVYEFRNAGNQSVWDPNTPMALPSALNAYKALWLRPQLSVAARNFKAEGYLGDATNNRGFMSGMGNDASVVRDMPLLTFYDALPPPVYINQGGVAMALPGGPYNTYNRSMMRDIDLTPLITGRRIIILGHLRKSPSPVPMTVDGDNIESEGWTVVRWIYDF